MKNIRFIILGIVLLSLVIILEYRGCKERERLGRLLRNNIEFTGTISNIKRSRNHGFGVMYIDVVKANIDTFDEKSTEGKYPYKIEGKKGEVYLPVYDLREIGDTITVISNKEMIYYNGKKSIDSGEIYIITNPIDVQFIRENTTLK